MRENVDPYARDYTGADVVDVLATDVHKGGFPRTDYDRLSALADGKPIALGEAGAMLPVEILHTQPLWAWFMHWGEPMSLWMERDGVRGLFEAPETLALEDPPWGAVDKPRIHYPVPK